MAHLFPPPINLHSLNKALEPFRGSYDGTRLTLNAFCILLANCSRHLSTDEHHEEWQQHLASLRNSYCTALYRDPDSLQVAQVDSRANFLEILREIENCEHTVFQEIHKSK